VTFLVGTAAVTNIKGLCAVEGHSSSHIYWFLFLQLDKSRWAVRRKF